MSAEAGSIQVAGASRGVDHIGLPMEDPPAMVAFYRALGLEVTEAALLVQVHLGPQMINFHRPELQLVGFKLRAPVAEPPSGDVCLAWEGSAEALHALIDRAGAAVIEGPVAQDGEHRAAGSSVFVRDPDGNLIEFITHPTEP